MGSLQHLSIFKKNYILFPMRNKGFVSLLTIVVTLLCLYYLSFTLISRSVQKEAAEFATSNGVVDPDKKQDYLDSVWHKPVYNFLGIKEFTYEEIKNSEISLGLDLQGGMHVTLEVSPVDIIRGLSDNNQDSAFVKALQKAIVQSKTSTSSFSTLFFDAYRQDNPGRRLAPLFSTASTRGRISLNASDSEVIGIVEGEIESAIDRSFTILSNRIDKFGTLNPTFSDWPEQAGFKLKFQVLKILSVSENYYQVLPNLNSGMWLSQQH
jgi:SecD/SecF fusion protein